MRRGAETASRVFGTCAIAALLVAPAEAQSGVSTDATGTISWQAGGDALDSKDARLLESGGLMPYLEWDPGQLPRTWHGPGSYHGGPAIHTLVVDFTGDSRLEILVTGLASGPLYAFDAKGVAVPGWESGVSLPAGGAAYPVALDDPRTKSRIGVGTWPGELALFEADGTPAWIADAQNFVSSPPSMARPGPASPWTEPRLHLGEEDYSVHARSLATGEEIPGWPTDAGGEGAQEFHTPAVGDLDGDGDLEIVAASGWTTSGAALVAIDSEGTLKWTRTLSNVSPDTFPVLGDLDGDGGLEIVVVTRETASPWRARCEVRDAAGALVWSFDLSDTSTYGTAPALANLDQDPDPEIVVQLDHGLHVVEPFGGYLAGWPRTLLGPGGGSTWVGKSAPVIGNVDSDLAAEIVVTAQGGGYGQGYVFVLDADGSQRVEPTLLPIGDGAVPAIADVDGDGHNEIVVSGSYWVGVSGWYDRVWMFDLLRNTWGPLRHAAPEWGQFMGNPEHTGCYRCGSSDH